MPSTATHHASLMPLPDLLGGLPLAAGSTILEQLQAAVRRLEAAPAAAPDELLALALWPAEDAALREALAAEGITITFVSSQQMLLTAYEALRPELLLIDPDMLDERGPMPGPRAPVIVLSAAARGPHDEPLPEWMQPPLLRAVRLARAGRERRRRRAMLDALGFDLQRIAAMGRLIADAPSPQAAVQQLMILVRDLFCVEAGTLYRYDAELDRLVFELVFGSQQALLSRIAMPAGRGIAGWVMRSAEPLLVADVAGDTRFAAEYDEKTGFETRSMLCVPLRVGGQTWGVLQLLNKLDGEFTDGDLLALRLVAALEPVVAALGQFEAERHLAR